MLLQLFTLALLLEWCLGSPVLPNKQLALVEKAQSFNASLELPEFTTQYQVNNYSDIIYDQLYLNANLSTVAYCISPIFPRGLRSGDKLRCALDFCEEQEYRYSVINVFDHDTKYREKNHIYGAGFIAADYLEREIVVAFRGTADINDAKIDLNLLPEEYEPLVNTTKKCEGCQVHSGFFDHYKEYYKDLAVLIKKYVDDEYHQFKVVVTGHSLGGAYALLLGLDLQLIGLEPTIITFGGPRVGNQNFANFTDVLFNSTELDRDFRNGKITKLGKGFWRVIAKDDYVPLLPPSKEYYHAGLEFEIESAKPVPQAKSEISYTGLFKYDSFFANIDWNQYIGIDLLHVYQHMHYFEFSAQCLIELAKNPLNYIPFV